jgi:hypothetical protein
MSEWIKFKFTSTEPSKIKVKFNDKTVENISEYFIDGNKTIWLEIPYGITKDHGMNIIGFKFNKLVILETIQLCGIDYSITDDRLKSFIEVKENSIEYYLPCPFINWWEKTFN